MTSDASEPLNMSKDRYASGYFIHDTHIVTFIYVHPTPFEAKHDANKKGKRKEEFKEMRESEKKGALF